MRIRIYVQPDIQDTFWVKQSQKAVAAEILRKRYTAEYLKAPSFTDIDFDKVFAPDEKRILIYIGTSLQKTPADLKYLAENNVHTIRINCGNNSFPSSCSHVMLNYHDAIEKAISYLTANGHDRIALFGINPCSPTDKILEERFGEYLLTKGERSHRDIYYNYASISNCYAHFANHRAAYNACICANDMAAIALLHGLKKDGVRVPADMYIVSCGLTSMLADQPSNAITTVSADRDEIGAQAVMAYSILAKSSANITLMLRVGAKLTVRASTAYAPIPETSYFTQNVYPTPTVDFFADPITQNFYSMESLLHGCDETDSGILDGLLAGETYPAIAEKLFTSANMIAYRVKRMCRLTGCTDKNELITLLKPYIE